MIKIRTDSNKIKNGDTFVAIKGFNRDGHGFIDKAINNGATKLIVEHGTYSIDTVTVSDTRKYLVDYLSTYYKNYLNNMIFIGITGTNGKTTTSYLVYQIFNKLGIKCSYIGTIGYYKDIKICDLSNTSPDTADLFELIVDSYESGYNYIVMEVSSQGLIHERFDGIYFDIALFTNLTQDHLDYHITLNNYAYTKQLLFKKIKDNGKAIINIDDNYAKYYLLNDNNNITYGFYDSDFQINDYHIHNMTTQFSFNYNNKIYKTNSSLLGKHNIYNLLGAISIATELGINIKETLKIIPYLECPKGRMEKINYNDNLIIIDYAHTPDAIDNIIDTVLDFTLGEVFVVFGCTGNRDKTKRSIMTNIVLSKVKKAIITVDDSYNEDPNTIINDMVCDTRYNNYQINLDRKNAIGEALRLLDKNDTLLILGKGHEEYLIVNNNKIPYSDYQTVMEYIESIPVGS